MNKHNPTTYDQLIALWDIQDSLLQSYRNIFLTSQSIIFAIAVFITSGSKPYLSFVLLPIGICLLWIWYTICRSRGYDVWFFHWQLLKFEDGQPIYSEIFTNFKKWQALGVKKQREKLENDDLGKHLLKSQVRIKMEYYLPCSFGVLWIILTLLIIIM
ncbi:MAG: hypothetical protein SVO01_10085 [Thermotogota bacterium]|nr:hypothetical protein [Thermotogota bacterium]